MQEPLDDDGIRRLVAAVLLKAVLDAQRGSRKARAWLAGEGALWADEIMGIHPDDIRAWLELQPVIGEPLGKKVVVVASPSKGSGLERFAEFMAMNPTVTNQQAAAALNLGKSTVRNYRYLLRRREVSMSAEM